MLREDIEERKVVSVPSSDGDELPKEVKSLDGEICKCGAWNKQLGTRYEIVNL